MRFSGCGVKATNTAQAALARPPANWPDHFAAQKNNANNVRRDPGPEKEFR
jgi:hypothetical protein